jgi:uncharacterized protein (DUF58 family)
MKPPAAPVRLRFTSLWLLLGPMLGAMLLAAINYDNNLVYMVLFWVVSLALLSRQITRRHVADLEIISTYAHEAFAGQDIKFRLGVRNSGTKTCHSIFAQTDSGAFGDGNFIATIEPGQTRMLEVTLPALRRGRFILPEVWLSTTYPLGLFCASRIVPINLSYIVYPKPVGKLPWPEQAESYRGDNSQSKRHGDDYFGAHEYQPGEPPRHIDWKAYARGRPLMVKEFRGGGKGPLWLEWTQLAGLPYEARVCQLARWVVDASTAQEVFGLRLPGKSLGPARGVEHQRRCLTALALLPMENETAPATT